MYIVHEASPLIKGAILDDKLSVKSTKYRPLSYLVSLKRDSFYLLFNLLTKEFVSLTKDEYNDFILPKGSSQVSAYLIKHLFLVEEQFKEQILADTIREIASAVKKSTWDGTISTFQIYTTTFCNVRCPYCFEQAVPHVNMSVRTASDIADYIIKKHNKNGIYIRWFGGEPLCNTTAITIISSKLANKQIPFYSALYTNGLLFTPKIISEALSIWNLRNVQITIDGTEPVYNRIKSNVVGIRNPFEKVINNVDELLNSNIRVAIRTHLTDKNERDLEDLFQQLSGRFKNKTNLRVYVNRLFSEQRNRFLNKTAEQLEVEKAHLSLSDSLATLFPNEHIEHLRKEIRTCRCFGDSFESVSILPDGNLIPCTHYDVNTQTYGSIYDSQSVKPSLWKEYFYEGENCFTCFYYPDCFQLKACPESPHYCNEWRLKTRLNRIHRQMRNDWEIFASLYQII